MTTVFILSAPSGSGKSTLVKRLLTNDKNTLFSVSYTTRKPRGAEVDGESYCFISRSEFEARLDNRVFLEHAEVFGNYYGTHNGILERAVAEHKDLVLDIDVQGARQLKCSIPDAVSIFILPPSREILARRLRARAEDDEAVIQRRLKQAVEEIRNYGMYDYVVVNDDLDRSTVTLQSIVNAERVRRIRVEDQVRSILATFD
jgi:guanylate kinase